MVRREEHKKRYILPAVMSALLLAAVYLMLCAGVELDRILPNTTVNEVSLDGMSLREAVAALEADTENRRANASLTVSADQQSYTLHLGELLDINCLELAKQAISGSRKPFLARGLFRIRNALVGCHITAFPTVTDPAALHSKIEAAGILALDTTTQTTYKEANGQLVFTMGTAGTSADEAALTEQITSALKAGDYDTPITCPMTAGTVEPVDIDAVYQEVHAEVADAALDPKHGYCIKKSVRGVDFDKEAAGKILEEAEEGSTAAIDLTYTEPKLTTRQLKKRLFRDRLAVHTTRVGGTAGRIANVRLAAAKCDGIILCSGEEFSFNDTIGELTAEAGFHKANAILGRKIIQSYGGGICQVSTTLFIPAMYAGLEIPERWNHNYVSSYAAPGMDAAVARGAQDFRIVNNRKYPIKLKVTYANGQLTASIWGTKTKSEASSVKIHTRVLDSSDEFLRMETVRKISSASDGNVIVSRFYSEYFNPSVRQD